MVKVEIERNGKREQVELRVKAKAGRDLLLKMIAIKEAEDTNQGIMNYLEYLDQGVSDSVGISVEQLNELDLDDKNKLASKIVEMARDCLGFSTLSIK